MELSISGNALKTFARSINSLAKIGNELSIQASPSQLAFYTLNSSRSAYQSMTFKPDFFDIYTVSGTSVQCSILLKAICAVLRTPIASFDNLRVCLPEPDASKVQWVLDCFNGMKKSYWITCNVEPDIQHLSLDRGRFPSSFVIRPRDLSRLLSNFQSSLQEITIIATEPSSVPSDAASEIGGKAVELRSYIDPTKDNDSTLHTQLWIDPMEEFVQYTHVGNPVDVTFGVKELKAFLSFCEGCEVDIHLFFEKAGEPILMMPKFGVDDVSVSNFNSKLVLATMLTSQLHDGDTTGPPSMPAAEPNHEAAQEAQPERSRVNVSGNPSTHTKIWSDLSGSAARSGSGGRLGSRQVQAENNTTPSGQQELRRFSTMHISTAAPVEENLPGGPNSLHPMETDHREEPRVVKEKGQGLSQHHPSNWVDADEDDDGGEENELCVQSTPPYCE